MSLCGCWLPRPAWVTVAAAGKAAAPRRLHRWWSIVEEVYGVLYEGRAPREAVENLMLREPKPEQWG